MSSVLCISVVIKLLVDLIDKNIPGDQLTTKLHSSFLVTILVMTKVKTIQKTTRDHTLGNMNCFKKGFHAKLYVNKLEKLQDKKECLELKMY